MKGRTLLALLLAAALPALTRAEDEQQRFGMYARLVAADLSRSTVMIERADGALWVFKVDREAARDLAALRAGDEVMLTFVWDGGGVDRDDVVRDVEPLDTVWRAGMALPFGVMAGGGLGDAAFVRTAGRETLGVTGVRADLASPGTAAMDFSVAAGFMGTPGAVVDQSGNALFGPGAFVGAGGLGVTGFTPTATPSAVAGNTDPVRPRGPGTFTPGTRVPGVQDPTATDTTDTLARPTASGPFSPGVVVPGVRNSGTFTPPRIETGFTPGNIAPGVVDTSFATPGRETLTESVPAALVPPGGIPMTGANVTGGTTGTGGATGTLPPPPAGLPVGGTATSRTGATVPADSGTSTGHGGTTGQGTTSTAPPAGHSGAGPTAPTGTQGPANTGARSGVGSTSTPSSGTGGTSGPGGGTNR